MDYNFNKDYKILIDYESYGLKNPKKKFKSTLNTINENLNVIVDFSQYGLEESDLVIISGKIIGEGTSSYIYKGNYKNKLVAVKTIKKEWLSETDFENINSEINIHSKLNHKNIIKLINKYENPENIKIVLEHADNNLKNIMRYSRMNECECKNYTKEILNGLKYLHDNEIIHRDIKPDNLLIKDKTLKICDFGLSKKTKIFTNNGMVGTNGYIAPEIQKGFNYTNKVDLWALGIIVFQMIGGYHPFSKFPCKYSTDSLNFNYRYWDNFSNEGKDFITKLLKCEPNERMSINEAINHNWIFT